MDLSNHLDVVARHDHLAVGVLSALGPGEGASLVGRANEDLRAVVLLEAGVTTTLLLGQDIHGEQELLVGADGARSSNDHATLDVLTTDTTEQETRVVAGNSLFTRLLKGLDISDLGLDDFVALADDLDIRVLLQNTALDTARDDGTTATDGEDVLNGHQEGLVNAALGSGDPLVDSLEQLVDLLSADFRALAFEGAQGRTHDDGGVFAIKAVLVEKLAHLHLDELKHFGVLKGINLVDEDDQALDTDLAGEEHVLTSLGHLTVGGSDHNDSAVHGSGTSDHVLDVIGVTRAVDVGVVPVFGRVLDVGSRDSDTTLALLRSLVNGAIVEEVSKALLSLSLGDSSRESRLAMVDVTNGTWNRRH